MRPDVGRDFDWQRKFIPSIKQILANYLIDEAPFTEDAQRNTDFMVLKAEVVRVACRVRRNNAVCWADEFTIRSRRPNGVQTELAKLLSGWGHYIFYGIADVDESELCAWVFGDLGEFRLWHHRYLATHEGRLPGAERDNPDGSSKFRVYKIADLPDAFVKARKHYRQEAA
jgi:hypothetical protein